MKGFNITVVLVIVAMIVAGIAEAQLNSGYTCYSVSVNSSTVPVALLPLNPPAKPAAWVVNERAANASGTPAAANILAFPYVGTTVPTGVPSACASPSTTLTSTGCIEITPTKPLSDSINCDNNMCIGPMGQPWAGVLESGSTAVTADSCLR